MNIRKVATNNLHNIYCDISSDCSYGIAGMSGSGKSSFCELISGESVRRLVMLLPKSEYRFLFSDKLVTHYSAQNIQNLPLVFYLGKAGNSFNPRSTLGTHTGVFREVRKIFGGHFGKPADFFSFNNSIMWCPACRGRGSTAGHECKECHGTRYVAAISTYQILKNSIVNYNQFTIEELLRRGHALHLAETQKKILENLIRLDVGYLSMDRVMSTLSGGEHVRVLLAEFMAECRNALIIIDEVSIGLDCNTLVNVLNRISDLGQKNQVWLIDHSKIVLTATEKRLFFGPGSGKNGGQIVEKLPLIAPEFYPINASEVVEFYVFGKLKKRNVQLDELTIPKNRITAITGESGCGKSTLILDCLLPAFAQNYKTVYCSLIGQDRNQSITSRSTVATFLDLKKKIDKIPRELLDEELEEIVDRLPKDVRVRVELLLSLGLGYLSFNRKVQTLSTGEFQCLHLISKLSEVTDKEAVLIFDEPSKGLSQNILNRLMNIMRRITSDPRKTILIIEHNSYLLQSSDYVIDFGKRKNIVTKLPVISHHAWMKMHINERGACTEIIPSNLGGLKYGIEYITTNVESCYDEFERKFKGGVLKRFSPTAQWIYGEYGSDEVLPLLVLDLEGTLYSKNTFVFEIAGVIKEILALAASPVTGEFDFYSTENLCSCCKGTGSIEEIDFSLAIQNIERGIWDGLLHDDIMAELKRYNFSKIKFLFREIQKSSGYDLNKKWSKMTKEEKQCFLYGYWKESFYDTKKKTQRTWQGILPLISKYMRASKSPRKQVLQMSKERIQCPVCRGAILKCETPLDIRGKDIREIVTSDIRENWKNMENLPRLRDVAAILGDSVPLNHDVSLCTRAQQVALKLIELRWASLSGFTVVLRNVAPFINMIKFDIEKISEMNKVLVLDDSGINVTKMELLDSGFKKGKLKPSSYAYEVILGRKKIFTAINKVRKLHPCKYCHGRGVLVENSIFEGVDVTETPCRACGESGISEKGMEECIGGLSVRAWLTETLSALDEKLPNTVQNIPLMKKICDLSKRQLMDIKEYIERE